MSAMHKLARLVRFSINPFLASDSTGFNSFASKPSGEGLSIFFELGVVLVGEVEQATGFVVNVVDIDKAVRQHVVPIFGKHIREFFRNGKHVGIEQAAELLELSWQKLADKFGAAELGELSLKLNPFRRLTMKREDRQMICFSEKFEFAAMHKLWNDDFSDTENYEVFGKCANPGGHGHNYVVEVTVKQPVGKDGFSIGNFERIVHNEFIKMVDHKNLNAEVSEFSTANPTVENITSFAWNRLQGKFGESVLHCVTVWETERTYCSYYGH